MGYNYNDCKGSFGHGIYDQRNKQSKNWGASNGGQHNSSYQQDNEKDPLRELPKFDLKNITKDLFDVIAEKCAKTIAFKEFDENGNPINSANTPTQLRRFYNEFVMWNERTIDKSFDDNLPFIYMIKSKVAYAKGRKKVDSTYTTFINTIVNQIENIQTLRNAKLFLEAFMGFYKQIRPED